MNNVEQGSLFDGIDMENIPEEGVKYSQGCSEMYRLDKVERSAKIFTVFKEKDLAGFHLKSCDRKEPFYVVSGKVTGIEMAGDKINFTMQSLRNEDVFHFSVDENAEFYEKALHVCNSDNVTVVMSGDVCADMKFGPFFGAISWQFVNGNNTAVKEYSVRK